MPIRAGAVLVALAVLHPVARASATAGARDLASEAMEQCEQGRDATGREVRRQHFERGEELASQAIALDDRSPQAHFAMACNLGEQLRLDGEKVTSVFGLHRLMTELDRTLELDPVYLPAMATKGTLLMRLPRMFGGNPKEGERLLREVVRRDDSAFSSRITLARACGERGQRDEAIELATRALEIAQQRGRADKVAEAQATLDQLGVSH